MVVYWLAYFLAVRSIAVPYLSLTIVLRLWKICTPDYGCTIFFKVLGLVTLKSCGRVTSHIFVKEPEGSWEKIFKYVNCTYGRIPGPSQKNNFMIYACTITGRIKPIERERYILLLLYVGAWYLSGAGSYFLVQAVII